MVVSLEEDFFGKYSGADQKTAYIRHYFPPGRREDDLDGKVLIIWRSHQPGGLRKG